MFILYLMQKFHTREGRILGFILFNAFFKYLTRTSEYGH